VCYATIDDLQKHNNPTYNKFLAIMTTIEETPANLITHKFPGLPAKFTGSRRYMSRLNKFPTKLNKLRWNFLSY